MERNAEECLNITLNHTLKSSALSSVLTTLPVHPGLSRLSFAANNALYGGNTTRHAAQMSPLRRKMWIFQFPIETELVFMEIRLHVTFNLQVNMRTFAVCSAVYIHAILNCSRAVSCSCQVKKWTGKWMKSSVDEVMSPTWPVNACATHLSS